MSQSHILIVDDDLEVTSMISDLLVSAGYQTQCFTDPVEALEFIKSEASRLSFDLVISDLNMPNLTGIELVSEVKSLAPELPIILVTAYATIESAIEATQRGVYDYLVKPFKGDELCSIVKRAVEYSQLRRENKQLKEQAHGKPKLKSLIGKSRDMLQLIDLVDRVANTDNTILISGEPGVGKRTLAEIVHANSGRATAPFVEYDASADTKKQSERLFTTDSISRKSIFEQADRGTLYISNIDALNTSQQAKLNEYLQKGKVKINDEVHHHLDVRLIVSTRSNLEKLTAENKFRQDLYYSLNILPINIPPLRHRRADIPLLVEHFVDQLASSANKKISLIHPEAMSYLVNVNWQGNVRELKTVLERAVLLADGEHLEVLNLPASQSTTAEEFIEQNLSDWPSLAELERRYILAVMEKTKGHKEKAAEILGINRRTLYRKQLDYVENKKS